MHSKTLNLILDRWALIGGVLIDLVLNVISFVTTGPDLVSKLALGLLAVIVVLFSVRAYLKEKKALWLMLAFVATFYDVSFTMATTAAKTEAVEGEDLELKRLTAQADEARETLKAREAGYNEIGSGYRSELAVRDQGIKDARAAVERAEAKREEYLKQKKTIHDETEALTADRIYYAIPEAIKAGRWIQLLITILVFFGLQWTIALAAKTEKEKPQEAVKEKKKAPAIKREIPKHVVQLWVKMAWYRYSQGKADRVPAEGEIRAVFNKREIPFLDPWHGILMDKARALGFVDESGKIKAKEPEVKKALDKAIQIKDEVKE